MNWSFKTPAQEQWLGKYTIVETGEERIPYELHGKRGARYGLLRNVPNPEMLFAVNLKKLGVVVDLPWFTDRDGKLEVA